jgi:hypothetical protein
MNQLTENISESGRDHCWIYLDMQKQHWFLKSLGPNGSATSRTINNHDHAEIMPENAGTTSVWLKRL